MALLQSICGAVIAINGLRLAIGLGSVALSTGAGGLLLRFHHSWIRLPMLAFALIGALINLAILLHVRRLRARPAAQWRRRTLTTHQVRMERVQWILSALTLLLIAVEECLHFTHHHHL